MSGSRILRFSDVPGPQSYPIIGTLAGNIFDSRCEFMNVHDWRGIVAKKIFSTGNALGYQAPGVGRDPSQSPKIWDHLQVFILTPWRRKHPPPTKTLQS